MMFPDGFLWGVAAAAYQIEGAHEAHGRKPSIWDAFSHQPGKVFEGHHGDVACDHYHRYPEDIALMADLGAKAYRFSISWPRILPDGTGAINDAGLDFYDRLVDSMLARGITPWATLFHWDLPVALFHRGGWLNRDSVNWFAAYTRVVAERLGDRVKHWMTLNEPQVFLGLGHASGTHAPGMRYSRPDLLRAIHHTMVAHGRAVMAIREIADGTAKIGWAPHGAMPYPATNKEADVAAARQVFEQVPDHDGWFFSNTWFADPVVLGQYPESGLRLFGHEMPAGFEADLPDIAQPLDFFGVNIYQGEPFVADDSGNPLPVKRACGYPQTAIHWPVEPEVLYWGPRFLHDRYKLPLYITENGCAATDWVHVDGHVHDAPRVDFLTRFLASLERAVREGVDVRGYFHWSILDNFEWAEGYRMRFGLVYVDYETLERIPKDSYSWYQQVILSNGGCLPEKLAPLR